MGKAPKTPSFWCVTGLSTGNVPTGHLSVTLKDPLRPPAFTAHSSHALPGSARIPGAQGSE